MRLNGTEHSLINIKLITLCALILVMEKYNFKTHAIRNHHVVVTPLLTINYYLNHALLGYLIHPNCVKQYSD